jgi:carbamoyltransferase
MTQFLGFEMLDGEFKVMGMAPYGDPTRYDLSKLLTLTDDGFEVNTQLANTVGMRRYKENGEAYYFSQKLINWLGPKRQGDEIDEPYIHYAASIQQLLEETSLKLIDRYLGDVIRETGKICFAGGVALNVKLNQRILALPHVKTLFVQPAAGDAGTAVGAATYVANEQGDKVAPLKHVYLGPQYSTEDCLVACEPFEGKIKITRCDDIVAKTADILAEGNPVAWFQGRMEFGPRALGNRSILGDPSHPSIAELINVQIKFRERWRPFCPSISPEIAKDMLQTDHPSPYMTFAFTVSPEWKKRVPEVVHEDGTARAQIVDPEANPRYYALLKAVEARRGHPVLLNTSLNRRGEPMVCSPRDALNMFLGCDLQYLVLGDLLVTKS